MTERITRRQFLAGGLTLAVLGTAALCKLKEEASLPALPPKPLSVIDRDHPYVNPITQVIEIDYRPTLNKAELMQFARRMSDVTRVLPDTKSPTNQEELDNFITEALPFYNLDGIIDSSVRPTVAFENWTDGGKHNYLFGWASCYDNEVGLNGRYINPQSSWYGRGDGIVTLLHELAHIQDICPSSYFDIDDGESSAQIVALEVTASMINSGHSRLKKALFNELKYMTASSLHLVALEVGGLNEFIEFRDTLYDDPSERAEWHKLNRLYQEDPENLNGVKRVLYRYNYLPLQKILKGLWHGVEADSFVDITVFPPISANTGGIAIGAPFPISAGVPKRLLIDDLAYQLRHA